MKAHQTYIISSQTKNRYYIGSTSVGPDLRLQRHNDGWTRSTKSGAPWILKYLKNFDSKSEALKWERFIKKQKSRVFIEKLINSDENEYSK